jgi:hypothetical protein
MDNLDLEFESGDLNKTVTIRDFFYELLKKLWIEREGFSGKRPFGNSSWDEDLIKCLIQNNLIVGEIDEDGYLNKYDSNEVEKIVLEKIIKPIFNQQ